MPSFPYCNYTPCLNTQISVPYQTHRKQSGETKEKNIGIYSDIFVPVNDFSCRQKKFMGKAPFRAYYFHSIRTNYINQCYQIEILLLPLVMSNRPDRPMDNEILVSIKLWKIIQ